MILSKTKRKMKIGKERHKDGDNFDTTASNIL